LASKVADREKYTNIKAILKVTTWLKVPRTILITYSISNI